MFCLKCGAQIEDGSAFCTSCGAPQEVVQPQQPLVSQVPVAQQPAVSQAVPVAQQASPVMGAVGFGGAPVQPPAPKKNKTGLIVGIIAAVAIVAVAVILFVFGGAPGSSSSSSSQAASSSAPAVTVVSPSAASSAVSSAAASSSSAAAAASSSAAASAPAAPSAAAPAKSTIIDLDDAAVCQSVNLFLSNFSELYMQENPFDASTASPQGAASFACWHTYRNSDSLVETDEGQHGYYDSDTHGPYRYNLRITVDRANEICQRYFGRTYDFSSLNSMNDPYYCRDGYIHFMTTNGKGMPNGVTMAKSATDLGDGLVRIDFEIYFTNNGYDSSDMSLYSCTPDELKARWGVSGPSRVGSAVVRYGDYNEYTNGLVLVSWEAHDA